MRINTSIIRQICLCAGLATFVLASTALQAAEQMKGGEHMLHLQGINTKADADALKPGDTIGHGLHQM